MTRVMIIGAGSHVVSRAIVEAMRDMALKVVTCVPVETGVYALDLCCATTGLHRQSEQHKKAMREHFEYAHAGIQQRRKALTKFHQEKRARMAHKQATKRRNRFV